MEFLIRAKGGIQDLADYVKTSQRTVSDALLGKTNSKKANMIRRMAVENGADVFVKVPAEVYTKNRQPDFETNFKTVKNEWIMVFSDHVKIIADLNTGVTTLYVDDTEQETMQSPTMKSITLLQIKAQKIANQINARTNN